MKRTTQRGDRSADAVPEALEVKYASGEPVAEPVTGPAWRGQGPAPAGALQRRGAAEPEDFSYSRDRDEAYEPRRGRTRPSLRAMLRGLARSGVGRAVLGVAVLVLVGGVAVGAMLVRQSLLGDARFVVDGSDEIAIAGNRHLTRAQVLSVFGGDLERNIFRVSLAERQADLERLPWIEHATVMRLLPNRLRVQIVERTPVAFARQGTQIGLVDAHGVLLDMAGEAGAESSFPVLTGIEAGDPLSTRAARMEIYGRFLQALGVANTKSAKSVSEVDVTDPEDVKALMTDGSRAVLVHFGDDQFAERYASFEKHLPEWRQQYPKLASADMRYEGQIVLEMEKGAVAPAGVPELIDRPTQVSEAKPGVPALVALKPEAPHPFATTVKPKAAKDGPPVVTHVAAKPLKVPLKPVVKTVAAKGMKPVAKPAVGHPVAKPSGSSAANERMFAALAEQRKAAQRKSAEARGGTP